MSIDLLYINLFVFQFVGLERVIALFEKPSASLEHGFPRTLRYIGFRTMSPDLLPETIDSLKYFAMSYAI